ncbi:cytosine deaminase [Hortaea werneckii]|nr:cytosine deaminase [Hortaea werneckii]
MTKTIPWTPNMSNLKSPTSDDPGFKAAYQEAKTGFDEGGVPIGACLVDKDGKILGQGHNMRVQKSSATLHAEISCFENAGRLPASAYRGATMYTTLSPCDMCTGACIMYKVARVVMGENNTFVGGDEYLRQRGIEVVNLKNAECEHLMKEFIRKHPEDWYEDIGEPDKAQP